MGFFKKLFKNRLDEKIEAFKEEEKAIKATGEGYESNINAAGFISRNFDSKFLYYDINDKLQRIKEYRKMLLNSEISSVIEDACIEMTTENSEGKIFHLDIKDAKLKEKENIKKNLLTEFNEFLSIINVEENINNYFENFLVDGELFFENIINEKNKKSGILGWKKLPSETMYVIYNYEKNKIDYFVQYLNPNVNINNIKSIEELEKNKDVVVFYPSQINYMKYGIFPGMDKTNVYGYLEKVRKPFNILQMLETSLIIYRLIRAPERFVFEIDTGNMPKDKALSFVEKMKQKLSIKESFNTETGQLEKNTNIMSLVDNFFLPKSSSGRGSSVSSIGGNVQGFTELDDIYYFQRKLYSALKYPISRIQNRQENRTGDNIFGGTNFGEMSRDEVKWSVFLEKQQNNFCNMLEKSFLKHLEFKNLLKQYSINSNSLRIYMNIPNSYKEQINQKILDQKYENFSKFSNEEYISKSFLMKKYLKWSDEEIEENIKGLEYDKKHLMVDEGEF